MEELKPCPFCGGNAEINQNGRNGYTIECTKCHISKTQRVLRMSMEWLKLVMVENWNKRT